jgi:hypothetical protein
MAMYGAAYPAPIAVPPPRTGTLCNFTPKSLSAKTVT